MSVPSCPHREGVRSKPAWAGPGQGQVQLAGITIHAAISHQWDRAHGPAGVPSPMWAGLSTPGLTTHPPPWPSCGYSSNMFPRAGLPA